MSETAQHAGLAPLPDYSEDGVDLTLIRWMLSLTPAERLQVLQEQVKSILRLRDGQARTELPGDS